MAKSPKRKTLGKKCDKKWGFYIHFRDNDECVVCGSSPAQAHHLIGRRNFRLRWEPDNGVLLCPKHHTFDTKFSAHQTPTIFSEWFKETYPQRDQFLKDTVNELWNKDYDEILERFNNEL